MPTFSLFRRTSSLCRIRRRRACRCAASARAASSRTLVLIDGIPFNDPFGGWVYWTRVPLESVDRIEMVEGIELEPVRQHTRWAASSTSSRSRPTRRTIELKPQYGNRNSPKFDFFASDQWGKVRRGGRGQLPGHGRVSDRGGGRARSNRQQRHRRVQERQRQGRVTARAIGCRRFFRAGYFTENRGNGKIGEMNDTRWKSANGGVAGASAGRERPAGPLFVDVRGVPQQLPGGHAMPRRRAASSG